MRVFILHAHPEPHSFNGALTAAAVEHLQSAGHEVQVSDLYAMHFNPVSGPENFTQTGDAAFFKQQLEELRATETGGFAPDIAAEQDKLFWCDALILQFPLWWFGVPAIMKGWVDRVFAQGKIYGGGKWYDNGVFAGKRALCSLTTGGPESMYQPDGLNGDIHTILFPIQHGMLYFTGFDVLPPHIVWGPTRMEDADRDTALNHYRGRLDGLFTDATIPFPKLADYDASFRLKK